MKPFIPTPTEADMSRDAVADYGDYEFRYTADYIERIQLWIRRAEHERKRAVAAESARDELTKRLAVIAKLLPPVKMAVMKTRDNRDLEILKPTEWLELIDAIHGEKGK